MAIDIVSSKVGLGVGSPGQVNEGLRGLRKYRLESCGCGGRKLVMSEYGSNLRVVAFHLTLSHITQLPEGHWSDPVLIMFFPFNAGVHKQHGFIANGHLSYP